MTWPVWRRQAGTEAGLDWGAQALAPGLIRLSAGTASGPGREGAGAAPPRQGPSISPPVHPGTAALVATGVEWPISWKLLGHGSVQGPIKWQLRQPGEYGGRERGRSGVCGQLGADVRGSPPSC